MRNAINARYSLVRYYYTQLSQTSFVGGSFYRPVFFSFPDEKLAYLDPANNVMLGEALKLSVRADSLSEEDYTFYFPAGVWCDIFNPVSSPCIQSKGETFKLRSLISDFHVHLRQGHIVPL